MPEIPICKSSNCVWRCLAKTAWCAVVLVVVAIVLVHPAASFADTASLKDAISNVRNYRVEHGGAPSLDWYFSLIEDSNLTASDQIELYMELVKEQKPKLSLKDTLAVLKSKAEAIRSFRCKYSYSIDQQAPTSNIYAFLDGKFYSSDSPAATIDRKVSAYDGEFLREVLYKKNDVTNATIDAIGSPSRFLRPLMPLCQAMMFRSELVDSPKAPINLAEFLTAGKMDAFETIEKIDGHSCLLFANSAFQVYLDIDRNLSLLRLDSYALSLAHGTDGSLIKGRRLSGRKLLSNFRDYGNGIWLPTQIELDQFDKQGAKVRQIHTTVQSYEINPSIDNAFFSDVIPEDAYVLDGARKMGYTYRNRGSIGELLRDNVPSKSKSVLLWLNVAIVLLLVAFMVMRKFKARPSGQVIK